jgi:cyclin-dependent kinase inhibitor 3
LLNAIVSRLYSGKTVVVHCLGGLGRTGVVVACTMLLLNKSLQIEIPAKDIIKAVRTSRPGTIQNYTQVRFIEEFLKSEESI